MSIKNMLLALLVVAGFFSGSASAQELIASNNYVKEGCAWEYSYTYTPGGGPFAPKWKIEIYLLKCNGSIVLTKSQFTFGRTDCKVSNPASGYTLTGNTCDNFTLYGPVAPISFSKR